jgi:hypothetical protein
MAGLTLLGHSGSIVWLTEEQGANMRSVPKLKRPVMMKKPPLASQPEASWSNQPRLGDHSSTRGLVVEKEASSHEEHYSNGDCEGRGRPISKLVDA